jgi:hypothetical protein
MSKRYTDSRKWQKSWLIELPNNIKLLWFYILDTCSIAGIWDVSFVIPQALFNCKYQYADVLTALKKQIIPMSKNKWFVTDFITFQYKRLNPMSPPHKAVIDELDALGLWDWDKRELVLPGEKTPLELLAGEMIKTEPVMRERRSAPVIEVVYPDEDWREIWKRWIDYKQSQWKFKYSSGQYEQTALEQLINLAGGKHKTAIKIIDQSITRGWKGLFALDEKNKNVLQKGQTTDDTLKEWHGGEV